MGLMDKANDFLKSEQAEQVSDQAIQAGGDMADKATGGKYAEQIDQAQVFADEHVGMPNAAAQAPDMRPEDQQ